jgi:hypothetical protein
MNIAAVNGGMQTSPDYKPSKELAPLNKLSGALSQFNLAERLNINAEFNEKLDNYCLHGIEQSPMDTTTTTEVEGAQDTDLCQFKIGRNRFIYMIGPISAFLYN